VTVNVKQLRTACQLKLEAELAKALVSRPATKACALAATALRQHSAQDSTIVQTTVGAGLADRQADSALVERPAAFTCINSLIFCRRASRSGAALRARQ
jgi:hypothetical protein